jgi:peroxiredoxin
MSLAACAGVEPENHVMSPQERLDAFKATFESGLPPYNVHRSVVDTLRRATVELIRSGLVERAPRFVLKDPDHRPISSRKLIADGPLVRTFYRGVWSPYCNLDLQALKAALSDVVARGASLMAISQQNGVNSRKAIRENRRSFPILGDPRGELSAAYGLRVALPDYLVELYQTTFGTDLSSFNDDPSWTLPMPARFIIDKDGIIAYAGVSPDCTKRPDPPSCFRFLTGSPLGAGHEIFAPHLQEGSISLLPE